MSSTKPPPPGPIAPMPPPPTRKSGQMAAVKEFTKQLADYNDVSVPKMDLEVDRMSELLRKVTTTPAKSEEIETPVSFPSMPRMPSQVDPEEAAPDTPASPSQLEREQRRVHIAEDEKKK